MKNLKSKTYFSLLSNFFCIYSADDFNINLNNEKPVNFDLYCKYRPADLFANNAKEIYISVALK